MVVFDSLGTDEYESVPQATTHMAASGSLITEQDAPELSRRLFRLGDQQEEIFAELEQAGYGRPAAIVREAHEELAASADRRSQLRAYWREYAKERLAGLAGPMNVLRGDLPRVTAYRSDLLAKLRADALAGRLISESPIASPQIEPTVKRYVEMLPDDPFKRRVNDEIKGAHQKGVEGLKLREMPEFAGRNARARYELLIDRYLADLEPAGFKLDSHRKTGLVFRRLTSDGRFAFLFVDESQVGLEGGMLYTRFALTLPKKAVQPSSLPLSVVASFSAEDVVPGFGAVCWFARTSYAQFCLAADANAFLAQMMYERVNALLTDSSAV